MTPTKSVFGRRVDPLQAFGGILNAVIFCLVVYSIFGALLWCLR